MVELIQRLSYFEFHSPVYISPFLLFRSVCSLLFLFPPASAQGNVDISRLLREHKEQKEEEESGVYRVFSKPCSPFLLFGKTRKSHGLRALYQAASSCTVKQKAKERDRTSILVFRLIRGEHRMDTWGPPSDSGLESGDDGPDGYRYKPDGMMK